MGRGRDLFDILEVELKEFAGELMIEGEEKREIMDVIQIFHLSNLWIVVSFTHRPRHGVMNR